MDEVGKDIIFPRGFQILVKIHMPGETFKSGLLRSDHSRRNDRITAAVGKILRMGPEAFMGSSKFPMGQRCTYNEWMIFRAQERQLVCVNETFLALINDDRFIAMTTEPDEIQTTFDLEYEHVGS
jgi:hypothetical protein